MSFKVSEEENYSFLNIDNAAEYLIARGLLVTKSIVDGDLKIIDASRRNRNLHIIRKNDTSLFIKQPNPSNVENLTTIKKETLLYLLMQTDSDFESLKEIAPKILDFDEQRNILITEFVKNSQSWNTYNYVHHGAIEKEESAQLGKIIATYHSAFNRFVNDHRLNFLQGGFIPVASIVRPGPEIFIEITSANLKLLKLVQQYPTFFHSLEELYSKWHPMTLIHGDIKWDNIIMSPKEDSKSFKINIVDWETASIGDPAWDIGSVFQEFIVSWLYFLPTTGRDSAEQLLTTTTHPIKEVQLAIRAFWNAYVKFTGINSKESNRLLIRSVKFCAARLVQSAYESLYSSTELSNTSVYMIQLSINIFNHPNSATMQLLGIPFRSEL